MFFRVLLMAAVLASGAGVAAGPLASYRDGDLAVVLRTEPCTEGEGGERRQAFRSLGGQRTAGCWSVNERGNPVVDWEGEGAAQELDGSLFRFEPGYAALLRPQEDAPPAREREEPPAAAEEAGDFPRPAWCRNARAPHELLVCRDRELSEQDLRLGRLWQSYRDGLKLSRAEQGRHKNEFYRRLKACGADRECVAGEQAARIAFYRDALGLD
ncbi:hypothetical protein [Caldimonas tepidiphila]|uniref:hypothetical protein n=1 Tax=Caldimonas tepidiphila TaxID=2315841 RepID=UPI000E5B1742|nr:hypothetical protein [Caldimonas tepidiphila]